MKTVHPEDIIKGMHVIVKRIRMPGFHPRQIPYSGNPMKVVSVDIPFIQVESVIDGFFQIDIRCTDLYQPSTTYTKTWYRQHHKARQIDAQYTLDDVPITDNGFAHRLIESPPEVQSIRIQSTRPRNPCPRCEAPMVEQMTVGGPWLLVCRECGFEKAE